MHMIESLLFYVPVLNYIAKKHWSKSHFNQLSMEANYDDAIISYYCYCGLVVYTNIFHRVSLDDTTRLRLKEEILKPCR